MLKIRIAVLLIFALVVFGTAYAQNTGNRQEYSKQLNNLITRLEKARNSNDSLQKFIGRFQQLNKQYNDNASLVYIEYCQAEMLWLNSDFVKAMDMAVQSLNDAQKWDVNIILPDVYALIGGLHKENTNYPMAFVAADKAIAAAKQNKDTSELIEVTGLKAMFKRGFAMHFNKPLDKDSSLIIRLQALKIAEANPKYESLRVPFYDNIAQHYFLTKDYPQAIVYANKGIALATKYGMRRSLTYGYDWLGEATYLSGNKKQGLEYLNKALALSITIKQPYRKMEIYDDLSNCYSSSGDYKNAFYYLQKYRWLQDSLKVRSNVKQIGELQIKYETAKKDKDLALANQVNADKSKQLTGVLIGATLFLVLIAILTYLYLINHQNNKKLKANNLQINEQADKLQTLMQELHHRVKNNLQVVSSLLSLQSNRMVDGEAKDALTVSRQRIEAMSIIHNSLYQHGNANKVNMKEFLPVLVSNVLESFGMNSANLDINMDILVDEIDVDIAMPLGLIINEWVTNIFKHAFKNIKERPAIDIIVFNNGGKLKVKIKDNGSGMPLSSWEDPQDSFGVKLMKILIKQISGKSHVSNVLGTTLELDIPYLKII